MADTTMKRMFAFAILLAAGVVALGPATQPAAMAVTATDSSPTQAAPMPASSPVPAPASDAVALPYTAEKVWYRSGRMRLGFAWEKVGTLAVTEKGIEFTYKDGRILIAKEDIRQFDRGHLPPDLTNTWIIVRSQKPDGGSAVAGFTTPPLTHGSDDRIYAAIGQMLAVAPR